MALKEEEMEAIIRVGKEFGARKIWLFGSALEEDVENRDIDLGVEGIEPAKFYRFFGQLGLELDKEVDLIDLDSQDPMRHIVRAYGKVIYG